MRTIARVFWFRDMQLLKAMGKTIFLTYQGDDARQGDFCRQNFNLSPAHNDRSGYYSLKSDASKRRAILAVEQLVDRIYYLNPDLAHVLPARASFMPYANIDPEEWCPVSSPARKVPVVVHAPTSRDFKGTHQILKTVSMLKKEGVTFDFRLIENVTREKARREYEGADLLIDQLLAGWYGGLAVELMALGKPVICYIRDSDLSVIPSNMREQLPIISASPATLTEVLRRHLTVQRKNLPALGKLSRQFVVNWHNPRTIVQKLISEYHAFRMTK
jgi:glycosyltransferase involved in cell wall biosynthesis